MPSDRDKKTRYKKLGRITIKARDRILFAHPAEFLPPLGSKTGILLSPKNEGTRGNRSESFRPVGKIVDVIGSVKAPLIVAKLDNSYKDDEKLAGEEYYYIG